MCKFLFPFLFVRDWHSGTEELSSLRVFAFAVAVGFIVLGIVSVAILQAPVSYTTNI